MNIFYKCYTAVMGRRSFAPLNTVLYRAALHGLGVMNVEDRFSGEVWLLQKHLKLGDAPVFIDAGANVGSFSRLFAGLYPRALIHALEPHPGNFKSLSQIEGIHSHNLALGSKEGTLELFDKDSEGSTFASVYPEVLSKVHRTEAMAVSVQCTTLDKFCTQQAISKVDFLKIDTEGYEFEILQGASELIRTSAVPHILFEFNSMNTISRVFMRDFRMLLPRHKFYRLLPGSLLPVPEEPLLSEIFGF